jgi:hypothetical protein
MLSIRPTTKVRHSARKRRLAWNNDVMKPETVETETPGRCCLDRLVRQLLAEARDRKRRVRMRLREMRGDWKRYPVRGPVMPNGRPSPQWVFYLDLSGSALKF